MEMTVFERLCKPLRDAIADAGYATPTPIQEKAIPALLEGRDLIGCAQTGTGKTAAFLLPIIEALVRPVAPERKFKVGHPRALVLSPTRELAAQTCENHVKYSKYTHTRYACVFGGVNQFSQVKDIRRGAEIVIATPGRLIDLMTQGIVFLDRVEHFVLDEADRMLDMGFLPDIRRILSKLPVKKQSMFFSATLSPEILKLAGELVKDPVQVMISPETPTVDAINQQLMYVEKGNKDQLLLWLLDNHPEWDRVIVFARTRHGADRVVRRLLKKKIAVAAIHSDKTQNQRTRALAGFKRGTVRVLVATDIASRGIDVPEVDLVVQMELPLETESYVHRIGRTARAGKGGVAIAFVAPEERVLVKSVERFIRKTIPVESEQPFHVAVSGKDGGLPPAPWIKGKKFRELAGEKKKGGKFRRHHGHGRRQPDFGQKARFSALLGALSLLAFLTGLAAPPAPEPATRNPQPETRNSEPAPRKPPAQIVKKLMDAAALTFQPKGVLGKGLMPLSLQVSPIEWVEIGEAFAAALQVIHRSGERRAAYLAKLKAQGIEEEPMSEAGIAFVINVMNNRFAFDKYGYLYFDDRFVKPEERPALKRVEALYRKFHKRWMAMTLRKAPPSGSKLPPNAKPAQPSPGAIVDRATEWRVRRVPIFRGFEDDRYQEHDALIVRCVDEFNRNRAAWAGATAEQAKGIPALTTALVKSHMIEETGGRDKRSRDAWDVDPEQVNVPGDWSEAKAALGLRKPSKRNEGAPEANIRAAIQFLVRKGFGVSGQPAANRPTGKFDNWQMAFRRYNGRNTDKVDGKSYSETYADHIMARAREPERFVAIRKKVQK